MQKQQQPNGHRPWESAFSREECQMFAARMSKIGELLAKQPIRDTYETKLRRRPARRQQNEEHTPSNTETDGESEFDSGHLTTPAETTTQQQQHRSDVAVVAPRHRRRRTRHVIRDEEKLQEEIRARLHRKNSASAGQATVIATELTSNKTKSTKLTFGADSIGNQPTNNPNSLNHGVHGVTTVVPKTGEIEDEAKRDAEFNLQHELRTMETDFDAIMNRPELLTFVALDENNQVIGTATRANNPQEQQTVTRLHELACYARELTEHCLDQLSPDAGPLLVEVQLTKGMSIILQSEPQRPRKTFLMTALRPAAEVRLVENEEKPYGNIEYPLLDMERKDNYTTNNLPLKYKPDDRQQRKQNFTDTEEDDNTMQQTNVVNGGRGRPKANAPSACVRNSDVPDVEVPREAARKAAQDGAVERVVRIISESKRLSELNENIRLQKLKEAEIADTMAPVFNDEAAAHGATSQIFTTTANNFVRSSGSTAVLDRSSTTSSLTTASKGRPK